ncbi:MAG: DUF1349 domain-containing protein [Tabrizicola sp.]|uniref:DUF1349 domain-containing protein n=1 Tax=Tabrizicola sp. TaxID=2005166 RepID=UPI002734B5E5|nr:DUF1349 domain-containing protein [Tabrizicola sp.]MDP3263314.1 DUF1349 domain-containing protein [Tabrizicola sp.]MDP3646671.1 DUF1349 domain-containing protein [Paracoccaceae bacterium]MDZ4068201.1 DUF1349 domain-containing protein [Tabrizicola sp.]
MTFGDMTWLNPPAAMTEGADGLTVTTGAATDFWRETFYGFTRHSGHHLGHPVTGDFTARVTVTADYQALYDQAGLMLRLSDTHWIKAGIEHTDGQPVFSTVVTNGQSDWATLPLSFPASPITLRLTRHGSAVRVDVQEPSGRWRMTRLAHLPDGPAMIGPMACSPERGGFSATFSNYTCGPAIPRALHEDHP